MGLLPEPGAILGGRYRLDRKLGQGGMGVVWAATDTETARLVALKVLAPTHDSARWSDMKMRLRREARAASAVRHPNVCETLDVIELEDGSPALVMEHLAGESLGHLLAREHRMELAEFAGIFVQVLAGVGAVHAHGIIHRDLKPENIYLVEGTPRTVKVLDFGIAKLTVSEGELVASTLRTVTGAVLGTPCYMSPEQFGERDIDERTDVWSLGLIAYRCLSGVLPTQADHIFEVFRNIVDRPLPPLEVAAPWLPSDVTALVGRMLERKRADRLRDLRLAIEVFARHAGAYAEDLGTRRSQPSSLARPVPTAAGAGDDTERERAQVADAPAPIDAMATTFDAVPLEPVRVPSPVAIGAPAQLTGGSVVPLGPEPAIAAAAVEVPARASWRRNASLAAAIVAVTMGGTWVVRMLNASSASAAGVAASAAPTTVAEPRARASAAPENEKVSILEPIATAPASATAPLRAVKSIAPPRAVRASAQGSAAAVAARSATAAPPLPPAPRSSPSGGLVVEPPF